ncbi:MAG: tetratricopeptide repeat protein [Candidatus Omnitrophota bacterium]
MRLLIITIVVSCIMAMPGNVFSQAADDHVKIKAEYEKLRKENEDISNDRDNLRAQMKVLLQYKSEIVKAQEMVNQTKMERNQWETQKKLLQNENQNLQDRMNLLKAQIDDHESERLQFEAERDNMRKSLSKSKAGYIIVDDLKRKNSEEKRNNSLLQKQIAGLEKRVKTLTEESGKMETIEEVLRSQLKELKDKYAQAQKKNKSFEKKLEQQPKRYAEVARENKVLLKRTALMHYNLGVFYTKGKEYPRAIAEFEKAVELNPEDTYAYFNLGYIYAEHYVDRPKAIDNFRKYLSLAKKEDKDVDWVKRYILTWETWEGKEITK